MTIKKIQAKNIREAMSLVKETFGVNAVILANKDIADGVELIVTDDFHEQAITAKETEKLGINGKKTHAIVDLKSPSELAVKDLRFEIESLKYLMQEQLSALIWEHNKRLYPVQALAKNKLLEYGVTTEVATRIATDLEKNTNIADIDQVIKNKILQALPVGAKNNTIKKGIFAIMGPSGVGKTTVIAKLAAQYALKFGTHDIAIISADTSKVGANEALKIYANILNIPIRIVDDQQTMQDALNDVKKCQVVLIDTPGVTPLASMKLAEVINVFPKNYAIDKLLVIPANMQVDSLEKTIEYYQTFGMQGFVLTKVDETNNLGGVLSVAIKLQLPIWYITTGQRIPDDLQVFSATKFVNRVLEQSNTVSSKYIASKQMLIG